MDGKTLRNYARSEAANSESIDVQSLQNQVVEEIRLLQDRQPEWRRAELYADHLRPLDPLERREAERLDRLLRQARAAGGERTRERIQRERARPWSEDERWTLRKRVWRERRDRERQLLEQREQTLLQREQELAPLSERFFAWLADLQQLEPDMHAWCAEQAQVGTGTGVTPALLDEIHQRRRQAAERHAIELLAHANVGAAVGMAVCAAGRDPIALGRAITPLLIVLDPAASVLRQPVVIAALTLLSVRSSDPGAQFGKYDSQS
jgi:hypothetical protein